MELGTGQMVAEARDGHALLAEAIDTLDIGLVLYGPNDTLVFCNKAFKEFYPGSGRILTVGRSRADILRDMIAAGIMPPPSDDLASVMGKALGCQAGDWPLVEQRLSDGRLMLPTAKRTPSGGLVFVDVDVTQTRRREMALLEAKEKAEQASRIKAEFLSNMTHELRTPLNAILGFSEMIMREMSGPLGDPRYRDYADHIHESGCYLLSIINDILDMSKFNAGRVELREQKVDLAQAIDSAIRMTQERARAGRLALSVRLPPGVPPLLADERQIVQMVLNLISNAIKFTPPDGRIDIEGALTAEGGYCLSVSDTGIGIAAEDIPTALEPFGQVDSSISRHHVGTGLGLPLVKSMIEAHGGTLEIASQPAKGTRISLTFPPARVLHAA
ncbi:sensor histidine kinase [Oceanibaculum pacificum]|nr:PAS domain-containing sensor histidine kinase [Oceanibaculum pacificum]